MCVEIMNEFNELLLAERIARYAHRKHKETSTQDEYIHHIERVVQLIEKPHLIAIHRVVLFGTAQVSAKIVAWLHDVIEDSKLTEKDLLAFGISASHVLSVLWLSREGSVPYDSYIDHLDKSNDDIAIVVKIADLIDHLRPNCPPGSREKYEHAYEKLAGRPWGVGKSWNT
jgi:(p)ppGpp synthase/HD superfamily hydrolase